MSLSSVNKEVATRLFHMLAVSEQTANAVKHDHASYAKLSLLTQQMNLLQQQATGVVEKTAAKAEEMQLSPGLADECTALSTEYNEGARRLVTMLGVDDKVVSAIKRDHGACAKLSILSEQVGLLQAQAHEAVGEAELNRHLHEISNKTVVRLVPGTFYFHYTQNGKDVISRISNDEWNNYEAFHGKYLYDWDFTFRKQPEGEAAAAGGGGGAASWAGAAVGVPLLPMIMQTPSTPAGLAGKRDAPEPAEPVVGKAEGTPVVEEFKPICNVLSRW